MSVDSLLSRLVELTAAVAILVIVASALGIMVGAVKPREALSNIAVVLGLAVAFVALLGVMMHLWRQMHLTTKVVVATTGTTLALCAMLHRRKSDRDRTKGVK